MGNTTYTPGSFVSEEDKRKAEVLAAEEAAVSKSNEGYDTSISEADTLYKNAADEYTIDANDGKTTAVEQQIAAQNQQTEFAIQKIEQQKQQAEKDYIKERSAAYADWQKQSNPYGVNAEKMASMGLTNSGYSESSQVSMYNTYQNRVTSARESFERAKLDFSNSIQEAKLQNSSLLAEISLKALEQRTAIILEGMKYKNTLIENKAAAERAIRSQYQTKYQSVLDEIYRENTLAEQKRQHDATLDLLRKQLELEEAQAENSGSNLNLNAITSNKPKSTTTEEILTSDEHIENLKNEGASTADIANELTRMRENEQISQFEYVRLVRKYVQK